MKSWVRSPAATDKIWVLGNRNIPISAGLKAKETKAAFPETLLVWTMATVIIEVAVTEATVEMA